MIYYQACNDSRYTIAHELLTRKELVNQFPAARESVSQGSGCITLLRIPQYAPELKQYISFKRVEVPQNKTYMSFGARFKFDD